MALLVALAILTPVSWTGASAVVPARAARPGRAQVQLAEAQFAYKREADIITFGASQSFVVPVKPEARSVREYVSSVSNRLILASWDPKQIDQLDDPDTYRIRFQKLDFLVLQITPEVDCKLLKREDAAAFISTGFRIPGLEEYVSLDSYQIKVRGEVRSSPPHATMTSFRGKVEFEVKGMVPSVLSGVPEGASRLAAEQLSRALLSGAQKRFCETLPRDYAKWASE